MQVCILFYPFKVKWARSTVPQSNKLCCQGPPIVGFSPWGLCSGYSFWFLNSDPSGYSGTIFFFFSIPNHSVINLLWETCSHRKYVKSSCELGTHRHRYWFHVILTFLKFYFLGRYLGKNFWQSGRLFDVRISAFVSFNLCNVEAIHFSKFLKFLVIQFQKGLKS